jgi:LuxR family maltose regulon positive regulatory protein
MARVLQEARSRKIMPDYVEILLSAFTGDIPTPVHAESVLPDPLTEREDDVLKLLAAGLSNREIAAELVVSQETAKKHAGSIYRKLGVHSRTEAAAKARELGLIS